MSVEAAVGSRHRRAIVALTPLIDVVFILLVFFMLAANLQRPETRLLMPGGAGTGDSVEDALAYQVTSRGLVPVEAAATAGSPRAETETAASIAAKWEALPPAAEGQPPALTLKADEGVGLQALLDAIERLEAAGVDEIQLMEPVE